MKYLICCLIFTVIQGVNAQVCTGDFYFASQQDLDNFLLNNPSCTSIEGNVSISNSIYDVDPILNLNALQNIQSISATFSFTAEVGPVSLIGLSSLTHVGGDCGFFDYSMIGSGPVFTDYTGLENLTSVIGLSLWIGSTVDLTPFNSLTSAQSIDISLFGQNNYSVVADFSGITSLPLGLYVHQEGAGPEFSGFHNLQTAGSINFSPAWGSGQHTLASFDALDNLISCELVFMDYVYVNNFISGFQNLETVTGSLWFDVGTDGSTYADFNALQSAGSVSIIVGGENIPALTFNALSDVGYIMVSAIFSTLSFPILTHVGSFNVNAEEYTTPIYATVSVPSLQVIDGYFQLTGLDDSDLSWLSALTAINGDIEIFNCPNLSNCAITAMCEKLSVDASSVFFENNAPGCNTVFEVLSACSISYVQGSVYADIDCDGTFTTGDIVLPNAIIHDQNNAPVGDSYTNGNYIAGLPDNSTTTIHASLPVGFINGPEYTFTTTTTDDVYSSYDFPLCPDVNYHDVSQYVYCNNPRPGFYANYSILVHNLGANTEDVSVTADLSSMPGATVNSTSGTLNGNTITWNISGLGFNQTTHVSFQIYVSPSTPLGTQYHLYTQAVIDGGAIDADLSNNSGTLNQTVVGSYDPNDITVDRPAIDIASMTSTEGEWLDYTIRFQNTGTAEAINVRVQDVMEEDLDLSTFQQLNASHPFTLSFDENRRVEWLFENIMLPDSFSNEEASHGFIHFRIKTNPSLGLNDIVENSAAIYFDYNEPVITNTATTVFYECTQTIDLVGAIQVCEGDVVEIATQSNFSAYSWTLNDEPIIAGNTASLSDLAPNTYIVSVTGIDTYCEAWDQMTIEVVALPDAPVLTANNNTITATGNGVFAWTQNGEVLAETGNTINITESGVYGASVTTNGCSSEVGSGSFIYTGINENGVGMSLLCYPNPVDGILNIKLSGMISGHYPISMINAIGQTVFTRTVDAGISSLDLSSLESGVYQFHIMNNDGVVVFNNVVIIN